MRFLEDVPSLLEMQQKQRIAELELLVLQLQRQLPPEVVYEMEHSDGRAPDVTLPRLSEYVRLARWDMIHEPGMRHIVVKGAARSDKGEVSIGYFVPTLDLQMSGKHGIQLLVDLHRDVVARLADWHKTKDLG